MLKMTIVGADGWDERTSKFVKISGAELQLQHCLVSLSKWESRFKKPFLSSDKKTTEETFGYIQCMSDEPVEIEVLQLMTAEQVKAINEYIEDKNTATWFAEVPGGPKTREVVTSEIIYHWIVALQIPWDAEYWHLNRLFTLIKVINEKNQPKKKMGRGEQLAQQRKLNAERLAKMQTNG